MRVTHRIVLFRLAFALAYSMPLHSGVCGRALPARRRCDPCGAVALRGAARPLSPPLRVVVTDAIVWSAASSGALASTGIEMGVKET